MKYMTYMTYVNYSEDDFIVQQIDDYGILVKAAWGAQSFVSSWHLVDERKVQLTRRTKPLGWGTKNENEPQAVVDLG